MKTRHFISAVALAAIGLGTATADPYKVILPVSSDDMMGAMVHIVNYDTGDKIDSLLIDSPVIEFKGEIDEPVLVRLMVDGNRAGTFILENGTTTYSPDRRAFIGSPLNDEMLRFDEKIQTLSQQLGPQTPDSISERVFAEYEALVKKTLSDNADNPIGYMLFMQEAGQLSGEEFNALLAQYPSLAKYQRVQKLKDMMASRDATQPGHPYADFSVTQTDGKTVSLSQFVLPGKYTLVDFWASWCGPCVREISVLKELYAQYHDKGLDIVGVAVWDKPEDTLAAIKKLEIPWPCIIDAQTVPTDLYGISGIPCIILIGPDGTILSRDKQDEDLKADVMKYLN